MPDNHPDLPRELMASVNAIAEPFQPWLVDNGVPASFDQLREPLLAGLAVMGEIGGATLTTWSPETLTTALELFAQEVPDDELQTLVGTLGFTLGFLLETDRWTGSRDDAADCLELITDLGAADEFDQLLVAIAAQTPDPDDEEPALAALPGVASALRVLTWVGSGRSVTPNGYITPEELPEAAVALDSAGEEPEEVPALASAWQILTDSGLLQRKDDRVTPSNLGQAALSDEPSLRVPALR